MDSTVPNVEHNRDRRAPYAARWAQKVDIPRGSTAISNPDTSTYNKSTEDNDT